MKIDLETILRQIWINGWERGKKQKVTPYDYQLGNDAFLKGKWLEIMKLFGKKVTER